ncbi:MAG TPA: hypothetical protein VHG72_14395 [Polyangia bacterium]|nr:hypothetical protein [Polyangia bacterium]
MIGRGIFPAAALGWATVFTLFAPRAARAADAPPPAVPVVAPSSPSAPGLIHEPAPRPQAAVRVQQRFAVKEKQLQLFAAGEYLSRGDFYNSPGLRLGAAYYLLESLGFEVQLSHTWSSLNATADEVRDMLGAIPDSHPPGWLAMVGGRYSIGYGKIMVGGLGGVVHFEPQAFAHGGVHDNGGQVGPSIDWGLGFLAFLTPRLFARVDVAVQLDWESRSNGTVTVWGTAPSLGVGGML